MLPSAIVGDPKLLVDEADQKYHLMVEIHMPSSYNLTTMAPEHQPEDDSTVSRPGWPSLYELAAAQAGHFTTAQAVPLGFSDQLLSKHVQSGNLERAMRGIYRIVRFPPAEHEDLVVAWLWSEQAGVISHETALQLHSLSDALPARIHMTLPASERGRRRARPKSVSVHYADIDDTAKTWIGPVPVTRPARTICDVASAHGDATLVGQAIEQGIRGGLVGIREVAEAAAYVAGFSLPAGATRVFPGALSELGDRWVFQYISGRGSRPPPPDWPAVADAIVRAHGGRLYSQQHVPQSRQLLLQIVWPASGAEPSAFDAARTELASVFSWQ